MTSGVDTSFDLFEKETLVGSIWDTRQSENSRVDMEFDTDLIWENDIECDFEPFHDALAGLCADSHTDCSYFGDLTSGQVLYVLFEYEEPM